MLYGGGGEQNNVSRSFHSRIPSPPNENALWEQGALYICSKIYFTFLLLYKCLFIINFFIKGEGPFFMEQRLRKG